MTESENQNTQNGGLPFGDLVMRLRNHIAMMAPHQKDRYEGRLLLEATERLSRVQERQWRECCNSLPEIGSLVWLYDSENGPYIGGRFEDSDGWLWAKLIGSTWWNGNALDGDCEFDDWNPTHWMRLPTPPKSGLDKGGPHNWSALPQGGKEQT